MNRLTFNYFAFLFLLCILFSSGCSKTALKEWGNFLRYGDNTRYGVIAGSTTQKYINTPDDKLVPIIKSKMNATVYNDDKAAEFNGLLKVFEYRAIDILKTPDWKMPLKEQAASLLKISEILFVVSETAPLSDYKHMALYILGTICLDISRKKHYNYYVETYNEIANIIGPRLSRILKENADLSVKGATIRALANLLYTPALNLILESKQYFTKHALLYELSEIDMYITMLDNDAISKASLAEKKEINTKI